MLHKLIMTITALSLAAICVTSAEAFLVSSCPLAGKQITGVIDGASITSMDIDCDDYGHCKTKLLLDAGAGLYRIEDVDMRCNETDGIIIAGVRCFYAGGQLYCPGVAESSMSCYAFGMRSYCYPRETPIYHFGVR